MQAGPTAIIFFWRLRITTYIPSEKKTVVGRICLRMSICGPLHRSSHLLTPQVLPCITFSRCAAHLLKSPHFYLLLCVHWRVYLFILELSSRKQGHLQSTTFLYCIFPFTRLFFVFVRLCFVVLYTTHTRTQTVRIGRKKKSLFVSPRGDSEKRPFFYFFLATLSFSYLCLPLLMNYLPLLSLFFL